VKIVFDVGSKHASMANVYRKLTDPIPFNKLCAYNMPAMPNGDIDVNGNVLPNCNHPTRHCYILYWKLRATYEDSVNQYNVGCLVSPYAVLLAEYARLIG
jgi:hypothetical protein